ncbi:hypothetical protein GGE46_005929, partial [Rhizobium etli]|nr:hypothetical protein [Rhizobium etli]MBB4539137.1 hypothetical protein [Rhizobium etli]
GCSQSTKHAKKWLSLIPHHCSTSQNLSDGTLVDAADQLRIVMRSKFTIQPLLNKSEARVGFAFVT